MREIDIHIAKDHVIVEGQRVDRPSRISPSQWMGSWERIKKSQVAKHDW